MRIDQRSNLPAKISIPSSRATIRGAGRPEMAVIQQAAASIRQTIQTEPPKSATTARSRKMWQTSPNLLSPSRPGSQRRPSTKFHPHGVMASQARKAIAGGGTIRTTLREQESELIKAIRVGPNPRNKKITLSCGKTGEPSAATGCHSLVTDRLRRISMCHIYH